MRSNGACELDPSERGHRVDGNHPLGETPGGRSRQGDLGWSSWCSRACAQKLAHVGATLEVRGHLERFTHRVELGAGPRDAHVTGVGPLCHRRLTVLTAWVSSSLERGTVRLPSGAGARPGATTDVTDGLQ